MSKKLTIAFAALFFAGAGYSMERITNALGMGDHPKCVEACKGNKNVANCKRECNAYAKCIAKHPDGKKTGVCPKFRP